MLPSFVIVLVLDSVLLCVLAQKLASLQRGMTYAETSRVMGCPGQLVSEQSPLSGDYATVEWSGPDSIFFKRTRIDFLEGKLLYYTTENRGAL